MTQVFGVHSGDRVSLLDVKKLNSFLIVFIQFLFRDLLFSLMHPSLDCLKQA